MRIEERGSHRSEPQVQSPRSRNVQQAWSIPFYTKVGHAPYRKVQCVLCACLMIPWHGMFFSSQPPKLRVSCHRSTHHAGRSGSTNAVSESNLWTTILLSQPESLLHCPRVLANYPIHSMPIFKFPSLPNSQPSFTFCFHPRHARHSTPNILIFAGGRGVVLGSLSVYAGAQLSKIGIHHSGKTRSLRRGETGKEKDGRKRNSLSRNVAKTTNQFEGDEE